MMVMHTRKSHDRDPLNNIYGGGGFVASADGIYLLTEDNRGSGCCTLFCTGREIEKVELQVQFDSESKRWVVLNDLTSKRKSESMVLAAIYVYIRSLKYQEVNHKTGKRKLAWKESATLVLICNPIAYGKCEEIDVFLKGVKKPLRFPNGEISEEAFRRRCC